MASYHNVSQGESLAKIARRYGFFSSETIWNHPQNQGLRQLRHNPDILYPGDTIYIPDKNVKHVILKTGTREAFRLSRERMWVHLRLLDASGSPLRCVACHVLIGSNVHDASTSDDGVLNLPVNVTTETVTLVIHDAETPILIGHLDPVEYVSGWRSRLDNLGYDTGHSPDAEDTLVKTAIRLFQIHNNLPRTGVCDQATKAKLVELHGC